MSNILIIRHFYYAADPRVRKEAEALVERGHEVDVVCLRREGEKSQEVIDGVQVYRLPVDHRRAGRGRYIYEYLAFFTLAAARAALLYLTRRYAVVQVNTMPDFLVFAAALPKLLGARVVLDMHELMPELYAAKFTAGRRSGVVRLVELAEGMSVRFADAVVSVHTQARALIAGRHGRGDKIAVVMNYPDERFFPHGLLTATKESGRRDKFVLVSHGTIVERLGYDLMVRALALLREEIPGIELHLAGEGEYVPALRALVGELDVADRVRFLGQVPLRQIAEVLAGADVGIVANRRDGFTELCLNNKLLEYLQVGLPVVASRAPVLEDYFDDSTLVFFGQGDHHDLARRVLDLYRHPDTSGRLRERGLRWSQEHNWNNEKQQYIAMIENLIR